MSNYVYCAASCTVAPVLKKYFSEFGDENVATSEVVDSEDTSIKHATFFASRGAQKQVSSDGSVFQGYVVRHDKREVAFSASPAALMSEYNEGCFFCVHVSDKGGTKNIEIRSDVFGQLPIFFFFTEDVFACSDSLFVLTDIRKHLGLRNSINPGVFRARVGANGFCDQLMSSGTTIKEIEYALPGSKTTLSFNGPKLSTRVSHIGALNIFKPNDAPYEEIIQQAAASMVGQLGGLMGAEGMRLRHDITGGLDSRTVLAASLAVEPGNQDFVLGCGRQNDKDLALAESIAGSIGVQLNENRPTGTAKRIKVPKFSLWFASSAGVYDPLYAQNVRYSEIVSFTVGGHGAEVYKGNFNWRSIRQIANAMHADIGPAIEKEASRGLEQFGIDPKCPTGSEWHYLAFRNALHSGRFTNAGLYGMRPMLMRQLVLTAHQQVEKSGRPQPGGASIVSDLLIHLNPELAALPFDKKAKNLSEKHVSERQKLFGKIGTVDPYNVVGLPIDEAGGPLDEILAKAQAKGFTGAFEGESTPQLLEKSYDLAPVEIKKEVDTLRNRVNGGNDLTPVQKARIPRAMGKLFSIHLCE